MAMKNHLPGSQHRRSEAQAINNRIQAALKKTDEDFSRDSRVRKGFLYIVSELFFRYPVVEPQFLFLDQTLLEIAQFSAKIRMHSRRVASPEKGATVRAANGKAERSTLLTSGTKITSHSISLNKIINFFLNHFKEGE
jgi:hypothetical protein